MYAASTNATVERRFGKSQVHCRPHPRSAHRLRAWWGNVRGVGLCSPSFVPRSATGISGSRRL